MNASLTPRLTTSPRPTDAKSYEARYVRTVLWLRTIVGVLGIALPIVVIALATVAFSEDSVRGSLSAYYYSGARDFFVAILSATGIFFIGYVFAERSLENTLSGFAGVAALLIPLFPTGRPSKDIVPTPMQKLLHEHTVQIIHFISTTTFLVALIGISFLYGWRERDRPQREGQKRTPIFWGLYHFICTALMAAAILWIVVTLSANWPPRALLVGEWVAAWAFGASWLMKGLEIDMLRKHAAQPVEARPVITPI